MGWEGRRGRLASLPVTDELHAPETLRQAT